MYSARDVTSTVENLGLITSSIISKKVAEGISCLVLDVKWGKGSFNKTLAKAEELAASLKQVSHISYLIMAFTSYPPMTFSSRLQPALGGQHLQ